MSVNEIIEFVFENYYKQIGFSKGNSHYSMKLLKKKQVLLLPAKKLIEKIPDPHNAKEHYHLFIRNKSTKLVKQKIITYYPKTYENPNIVDIKSVITEYPKTSHKLSKTIRQAEKLGFNSYLYSDTEKVKKF